MWGHFYDYDLKENIILMNFVESQNSREVENMIPSMYANHGSPTDLFFSSANVVIHDFCCFGLRLPRQQGFDINKFIFNISWILVHWEKVSKENLKHNYMYIHIPKAAFQLLVCSEYFKEQGHENRSWKWWVCAQLHRSHSVHAWSAFHRGSELSQMSWK